MSCRINPIFLFCVIVCVTSSPVLQMDDGNSIGGKTYENLASQQRERELQQRRSRPAGCPSDFVYLHSVNGCYKMVTDKLTWNIAGLRCHAIDSRAHLVIINSADEQRNVVENIAKYHSGCGALGFWIAGQRMVNPDSVKSEFVWKIVNGESSTKMYEMRYTHWLAGQPDYYGGGESCAHAWQQYNYQWNDCHCLQAVCSICEIDL